MHFYVGASYISRALPHLYPFVSSNTLPSDSPPSWMAGCFGKIADGSKDLPWLDFHQRSGSPNVQNLPHTSGAIFVVGFNLPEIFHQVADDVYWDQLLSGCGNVVDAPSWMGILGFRGRGNAEVEGNECKKKGLRGRFFALPWNCWWIVSLLRSNLYKLEDMKAGFMKAEPFLLGQQKGVPIFSNTQWRC